MFRGINLDSAAKNLLNNPGIASVFPFNIAVYQYLATSLGEAILKTLLFLEDVLETTS